MALQEGSLQDPAPLGWFLLTLASQVEDARQDPVVLAMADLLLRCEGGAKKAGHQLKVVLAGVEAAASGQTASVPNIIALEDLHTGPGGRHDNDHYDYRSIKVIPTPEEALCLRQPFLPRMGDTEHLPSEEAALLDRHFRLVREDMIQPGREALASLDIIRSPEVPNTPQVSTEQLINEDVPATVLQQQNGTGVVSGLWGMLFGSNHQAQAPTTAVSDPPQRPVTAARPTANFAQPTKAKASAQVQRNVFSVTAVLGVAQKPRPCIMVAVELPKSHRAARMKDKQERVEFWTEFGRGTLAADALVCLVMTRDDQDQYQEHQQRSLVIFGTIGRRDPKELAEQHPIVGLSFDRGQEAEMVLQLMGC